MTTLDTRHALITGGGSGIGLAIAIALKEAGAAVTITGRTEDRLNTAAQEHGLTPLVMDVTDEDSVVDGTAKAVEAHGPIAICIANAGVAEGRSLHKTDLSFWRQITATNLDGAFLTIRESLRTMRELDYGRVIAISSIAGVRGLKGAPAYTASKHGVIGLIRGLSEDFLGKPQTFNAICPAYVDTDIVTRNVTSIADRAGVSQDEALKIMTSQNRHGKLLESEEIAAAALWLCDPASRSVNGQCIEIAGGMA